MKFEYDWCRLLAIILAGLTVLLTVWIFEHYRTQRKFIESGYTRKTLPGSEMTQWVKP